MTLIRCSIVSSLDRSSGVWLDSQWVDQIGEAGDVHTDPGQAETATAAASGWHSNWIGSQAQHTEPEELKMIRVTATRSTRSAVERAHLTFWTLGATDRSETGNGDWSGDVRPGRVPVADRIRRLPGALLLTTGYYAGKAPVVGDLVRRPRC
jgi:hypothetical protein